MLRLGACGLHNCGEGVVRYCLLHLKLARKPRDHSFFLDGDVWQKTSHEAHLICQAIAQARLRGIWTKGSTHSASLNYMEKGFGGARLGGVVVGGDEGGDIGHNPIHVFSITRQIGLLTASPSRDSFSYQMPAMCSPQITSGHREEGARSLCEDGEMGGEELSCTTCSLSFEMGLCVTCAHWVWKGWNVLIIWATIRVLGWAKHHNDLLPLLMAICFLI